MATKKKTAKKWYDGTSTNSSLSDRLREAGVKVPPARTANTSLSDRVRTTTAAKAQATKTRQRSSGNVSLSDRIRTQTAAQQRAPVQGPQTKAEYVADHINWDYTKPQYEQPIAPEDPYQVKPSEPSFSAALRSWKYPTDIGQNRRDAGVMGLLPRDRLMNKSWQDWPSDMDGAKAYNQQLSYGRPLQDVQDELARRAKKRAEANGGVGEYTDISAWMTEGEQKLYNTELFTPQQQAGANVRGVWSTVWDNVKRDWADTPQAGRGLQVPVFGQDYQTSVNVMEAARANNYEIIKRAEELRLEHYNNLIRGATMGGTMPYQPDGTIGTIDTIAMEPFMAQAERELAQKIIIPNTTPAGVAAGNLFYNAMQTPISGTAANILGNSLGTLGQMVQGGGRTLWSIPHYEEVTGDLNVVTMGELASATTHAIGQAAKTAWDTPPWQYTEEVNPIATYNQALPAYINRIVQNVYSFGPVAGKAWNPSNIGAQNLLHARAVASSILAFSGVEAEENALQQIVNRQPTIDYLKKAIATSQANAYDPTQPREIQSQEALNAAMMQSQLDALEEGNLYTTINANIDPIRDTALSIATDFTMWWDIAHWFGLSTKSISPFTRRLSATTEALNAVDAQIIKQLETDGIAPRMATLMRPAAENARVEVHDARALFAYTFQQVTVKSDIPTILQYMVSEPEKFFTQGIPVTKILSPGLKMLQEGGYVKFPHIQSSRAAFSGVLKTLAQLPGDIANLPGLTTGNNMLLADVIDDLTTVTEIAAADKYRTGTMPFATPVGTAKADVRSFVDATSGQTVYAVELKNAKGVVLGRKLLPTQQLAEKAAGQVTKALKNERFIQDNWITEFTRLTRSYASGAYLSLVPGSNITNAANGLLSIWTAGVGNWEPIEEILARAERTFGGAPYEYLVRGKNDEYFIKSGMGVVLEKAREIRGGHTTVPLTGGRLAFGEYANKTRAWWGGAYRAMDTFYTSLWNNELGMALQAANVDPALTGHFKAALKRLGRTWDVDGFNKEIASVVNGKVPTFNPSRYGNTFIEVLSEDAIKQIDQILAIGGKPEDVVTVIDAEIAKIGNDITANPNASVPVNVAKETTDNAKQVAGLAGPNATPEVKAASNAVTQAIQQHYDSLVTAFSAAMQTSNPQSGALISGLWDEITLAKRELYTNINELAAEIKASGDNTRWTTEYQPFKLNEWAKFADNVLKKTEDTLGMIARGEVPDPAKPPVIRTDLDQAPDIAGLGKSSADGAKLEQVIETHRAYKNYYMDQFFETASQYGDARTLNTFLTTFNDIARRESVLWAQINELSKAIDAATTPGARGKALRLYKQKVAKWHYDFSVWASAKWRAAKAYVEHTQSNVMPGLAEFTHPTLGRGTVIGISDGNVIVRFANDVTMTMLPAQLPENVMANAKKRLAYLGEMEKKILQNGYIDVATEQSPTLTGPMEEFGKRKIPDSNYDNPIKLGGGGLLFRENGHWYMRTANDPEHFRVGDKLVNSLLLENGYELGPANQLLSDAPPVVNDFGPPPADGAPIPLTGGGEVFAEGGKWFMRTAGDDEAFPIGKRLFDSLMAENDTTPLSGGGHIFRENDKWYMRTAADGEAFPIGDKLANRLLEDNGLAFDAATGKIGPAPAPAAEAKRSHKRTVPKPKKMAPITDQSVLETYLSREARYSMERSAAGLKRAAAEAPAGAKQIKARTEAKAFAFSKGQVDSFVRELVKKANDMVAEMKAAEAAKLGIPTVAESHNDTIGLLNQLKSKVIANPELITSRSTQLTPAQLTAMNKAQKTVRSRFREFAEASSVFGDKMAAFTMVDTTGQNWVQTLMSIPFPFHTFQTATLRSLMERLATQPAMRHLFQAEAKMYEHYNGDASQEYVTVTVGGKEYRVYVGLGKYMMNLGDFFNAYRYGDNTGDGGLLGGVVEFGNALAVSPYPWIDAMWRHNRGETPYWKGYLPQTRALFNAGLATFGKSVPAWLLEDRDIGYITNELGLMAQEKMITDAEAQYAASVLRHLRNPDMPVPEFMREKYGDYANILNTAMQRVGQRGTVSSLSQYFLGVTVVPRVDGQDELEAAKKQYNQVGWPQNASGSRMAQQEVARANPGIYVSFTRYNIDDPKSEDPALSARRQEYYDKADVIFGEMARGIVELLAENPTVKSSVVNDTKRPFWDQIEALKKEYAGVLDAKFERNFAKMNPSERAIYELEALLRYDDAKPPFPADDATPEERADAFQARADWESARLNHIERNIAQLSAEDSMDAWKQKMLKFVTNEYASELVRKYEELKYATPEEKKWSGFASVIDERRAAEWDRRYAAVRANLGEAALKAARVYSQIEGEADRKQFREEHPELTEAWAAMYNTMGYDQVKETFGASAWDTYREYKDALPTYPGQDASGAAKARYYDELGNVNKEYENGYEIRLFIDGRWRWWYEEEGTFDESGKFGGDYQEAIALFGEDIFDLYNSPNGYKDRRVQAFNEWRNEFQDKPPGAVPPPGQSGDALLNETEQSYDPNEFYANYYGPRPVGSEREPVLTTAAGQWNSAIQDWRDKAELTPQEFVVAWNAAAGDPAVQKNLLTNHPQYAAAIADYEKARGNPNVLDPKKYYDAAAASRSGGGSRSSRRTRYYSSSRRSSSRRYYSSGRRYSSGGGGGGGSSDAVYWDNKYQPMFQPQGVSGKITGGLQLLQRADQMDGKLWESVLERYRKLR